MRGQWQIQKYCEDRDRYRSIGRADTKLFKGMEDRGRYRGIGRAGADT